MQRIIYTKHNNKFVSKCDCYLESHQCPVLQGAKYDVQYNRPTDKEEIYIHKKDFQKPEKLNLYCRAPEHNRPFTQTRFFSYVGVYGTVCCKEISSNNPEDIRECAMINKLYEHNIPLTFAYKSWALPFMFAKVNHVVEVWIKTDRLDKMYLFDGYSIAGTCADCKWHQPWNTHDFAPKRTVSCDGCAISSPHECAASKMRSDGYTACEADVKCFALRRAQIIKEKYKDNKIHL